jgi:death-on-curing protein
MITLTKEQVLRLHTQLIEATGGLNGLRDEGLLDSALASPFHTFDGEELYPSVVAKVARLAHSLICNHAFVDGNKRIGTYVMLLLLELNHIDIDFTDDDLIRIGLDAASGTLNCEQLLALLLERTG